MNPAELAAQTAVTAAFIDADPVELTLVLPSEKVPDGEGGWTTTPEAFLPIRGRLIPQSDKVPVMATPEGFRPRPEFILMTLPDVALKTGSKFQYEGLGWRIDQVHIKPAYEKKGDVFQDG